MPFLDESSAKTNMTRLYGRALYGNRCVDAAPHGHWKTTTMLSSIRLDGSTECVVFDGAVNAEIFRINREKMLAPRLRDDDVVVMDNLSAYKDQKVIVLIEQRGARVLLLPAYSPDFNPIEKMWSKVKQILRSIKARSQETLLKAIATALDAVTAQDAKGWFASCGYRFFQD
nr:IS630 family transposase [Megalodesulfovibrio gigas]